MPRERLGPWGRWYASTEEDTAHYSDRAFRAWAGIFGRAVTNRGALPKLRPLRALYGAEDVDFLIAEGRLIVDGESVSICQWSTYQAPIDRTNADRQARWRRTSQHGDNAVDNSLDNESNGVMVTKFPTSTSTSTDSIETSTSGNARDGSTMAPDPNGDRDSLDVYHEITASYPWGKRAGAWLRELEAAHGLPQTEAALRVEWREKAELRTLLQRVAGRLARSRDKAEAAVEQSRRSASLRPPEPPQAREPTEDERMAGEAARAALRASYGRRGNGKGLAVRIGDLLPSLPSDGAGSPALLNEVEASDTRPIIRAEKDSSRPGVQLIPSLPRPTVRDREPSDNIEAPEKAGGPPDRTEEGNA